MKACKHLLLPSNSSVAAIQGVIVKNILKVIMTKPFLMALFLKTKEVEVVPRCWTEDEAGRKKCYWPKYTELEQIYTSARNQDPPNRKMWKSFTVKIYHEFDDYEEAVSQIPHFLNYSDYEDLGAISNRKSIGKGQTSTRESITVVVQSSDSEEDSPSSMYKKYNLGPVLPDPPVVKPNTFYFECGPRQALRPIKLVDAESSTSSNVPENVQPPHVDPPEISIVTSEDFSAIILMKVEELTNMCARNFASIKLQQNSIIATIEDIRLKMSPEILSRRVEPSMHFGFPFKCMVKFLEFDNKLKEDQRFRESAKLNLAKVGGKDLTDVTNCIFKKLMTDEVTSNFTMYGTSAKSRFVDLKTYNLILDSIRSVHITSGTTEAAMKTTIMSWLLHTADRIKASQRSAAKKSGQALL